MKVELELEVELASYAVSLLIVARAYHVVSLYAQLTRSMLAIAKFLVSIIGYTT